MQLDHINEDLTFELPLPPYFHTTYIIRTKEYEAVSDCYHIAKEDHTFYIRFKNDPIVELIKFKDNKWMVSCKERFIKKAETDFWGGQERTYYSKINGTLSSMDQYAAIWWVNYYQDLLKEIKEQAYKLFEKELNKQLEFVYNDGAQSLKHNQNFAMAHPLCYTDKIIGNFLLHPNTEVREMATRVLKQKEKLK